MSKLRLILGDQLSHAITSLQGIDIKNDVVIMTEVTEEATYVKHHQKKIAFLFSAMRHFAEELASQGINVRYISLDAVENTGTLTGEISRALASGHFSGIVVTEPGEYRLLQNMKQWPEKFSVPVDMRPDNRFLCSHAEFKQWAGHKKQLRMEYFYREMRKKYQLLLDSDGKPSGGQWNYDHANRQPPKPGLTSPKRLSHKKSAITLQVIDLVKARFGDHFGVLEPFHFAVNRTQAFMELEQFIEQILPFFGEYQDAMVSGEPYLYHSLLSCYINAGLLLPLEVCQRVEAAYRKGNLPINAAEGFIRQILGWREFVRGIYWLAMPDYRAMNYFSATKPLPAFYWTAQTRLFCLAEAIRHTQEHAYSHHIQRLMIIGNFALLAGLNPSEVCEWYLLVYADAYEWVELPNTLGMALFADGGIMASKPYAASGKYIHRMSNYCQNCHYDPNQIMGEKACPFNALYWDFLARNQDKLEKNQRLSYVYATWRKMSPDKQTALREQARQVFTLIETNHI